MIFLWHILIFFMINYGEDLDKCKFWGNIESFVMLDFMRFILNEVKSADPASPWPRQGGAWDHRRCGTLLSLKAIVNCTTASDLLWASKTDGCIAPPSNPSGTLATASVLLCGSKLTDAPCPALKYCL